MSELRNLIAHQQPLVLPDRVETMVELERIREAIIFWQLDENLKAWITKEKLGQDAWSGVCEEARKLKEKRPEIGSDMAMAYIFERYGIHCWCKDWKPAGNGIFECPMCHAYIAKPETIIKDKCQT